MLLCAWHKPSVWHDRLRKPLSLTTCPFQLNGNGFLSRLLLSALLPVHLATICLLEWRDLVASYRMKSERSVVLRPHSHSVTLTEWLIIRSRNMALLETPDSKIARWKENEECIPAWWFCMYAVWYSNSCWREGILEHGNFGSSTARAHEGLVYIWCCYLWSARHFSAPTLWKSCRNHKLQLWKNWCQRQMDERWH